MPYLNQNDREFSARSFAEPISGGEITFQLQQVLDSHLRAQLADNGEIRYEDLCRCLGALEGAKADFIERILQPYELKAQVRNGDVWSDGILRAI